MLRVVDAELLIDVYPHAGNAQRVCSVFCRGYVAVLAVGGTGDRTTDREESDRHEGGKQQTSKQQHHGVEGMNAVRCLSVEQVPVRTIDGRGERPGTTEVARYRSPATQVLLSTFTVARAGPVESTTTTQWLPLGTRRITGEDL